jgi:TorA maturation chaperone TorD
VTSATPPQILQFSSPDEDEELQRAELYGLLSRLWFGPPDDALLEQFASAVTQAPEQGAFLEEPWQQLVAAMRGTTAQAAAREYGVLFIGTGKAEILLYGSYHLTGALNERPLVELRSDLAALGLTHSGPPGETEDHVSAVFDVMRYLIAGDDGAVCNLEHQRVFFRTHVQPWVGGSLCEQVERHPQALTYAPLAKFTKAFLEVETQGFDLIE